MGARPKETTVTQRVETATEETREWSSEHASERSAEQRGERVERRREQRGHREERQQEQRGHWVERRREQRGHREERQQEQRGQWVETRPEQQWVEPRGLSTEQRRRGSRFVDASMWALPVLGVDDEGAAGGGNRTLESRGATTQRDELDGRNDVSTDAGGAAMFGRRDGELQMERRREDAELERRRDCFSQWMATRSLVSTERVVARGRGDVRRQTVAWVAPFRGDCRCVTSRGRSNCPVMWRGVVRNISCFPG